MEIVARFCDSDDFCQQFVPPWQQQLFASGERLPESRLCVSAVMTLVSSCHQSG